MRDSTAPPPEFPITNMDNTTIPPDASLHSTILHSSDAPFLTPNPISITTNTFTTSLSWWKSATCYQVWPASFKDSNSDGLGDLQGILSKLDYLADLGIDCIWLSPMYKSPQKDMGYDISDYTAIHAAYGTMDDMDELIAGCHNRGIRLLLDLVVNHTSDQHKWFEASRKGKAGDGKFGDFYIWKDGKVVDGKRQEPNNWGSIFGGSAWEWDEFRKQYYLHIFAKGQPDLNWEPAHVREVIREDAMHFWFRKGIDGFRIDTSNIYSKDPEFKDGEVNERFKPWGSPAKGILDGPRIHEWWREIRKEVLDKYGDPFMVGELGGADYDTVLKYISSDDKQMSAIFDFDMTSLGGKDHLPPADVGDGTLPEMKMAIQKTQDWVMTGKAWSTVFTENHDNPRSLDRFGSREYWERSAKLLCMFLTTLSGTLFVYQGEEIGMTNIPESWSIEDIQDIAAINYLEQVKQEHSGDEQAYARAWKGVIKIGRDNARTPVQWSSEPHAGFSTVKPWMRVNENYQSINVEDQKKSSDSILAFWKTMIQIRKKYKTLLMHGTYKVHDFENQLSWTFEKRSPSGGLAVIVLNFSDIECELRWPKGSDRSRLKLVMSNVKDPGQGLQPWEGRLYTEE